MEKNEQNITRMLGVQYYKFDNNNEAELIRVVDICGTDEVKVLYGNGSVSKMKTDIIFNEYTRLQPDGLVTISVVSMGKNEKGYKIEDVVTCLYRESDTSLGNYEPFCVCRQNITDFFYNYLTTNENHNMAGVSVSIDSCPENIDYSIMRACEEVTSAIAINIYIEDNVDSVLSMAKSKMKVFNRTLEACFEEHIKATHKIDIGKPVDGYCKTLKELLKLNNFQFDYDSAFNILSINENIEEVIVGVNDDVFGNYYSLPNYITNELSKMYKQNIVDTIVVPYNHEMELSDLAQTKYLILRDNTNQLYIVNYVTQGEYRESDLEVIAAKDAMNKVKNLFLMNDSKYN